MANDALVDAILQDVESAQTLTSDSLLCRVDHWVSTGSFAIDKILEGGLSHPRPLIPYARITEISGLEGAGKTTLGSMIFASAQTADDAICILADTEETYAVEYAEKLGVDLSKVIHIQSRHMEDLFLKIERLLNVIEKKGQDRPIVILWDSVGQTQTRAEAEVGIDKKTGQLKTPQVMTAAKVLAQNIRRVNGRIAETRTAFICINQMYMKQVRFGSPWETYGGQRLKHAATVRIRLVAKEKIVVRKEVLGQWIEVSTIKNKINPGFKEGLVPLLSNVGFSDDYLIYHEGFPGLKKKGGGYSTWTTPKGDEVAFRGWNDFCDKVIPHPEYDDLVEEFFA